MAVERKKRELQLPVSRIKTIMRSSPNVETIGLDSLHLVAKCTELFVRYLTINGLDHSTSQEKLDYKGLATFANQTYKLAFLTEILPHKMKFKDIRAMLENDGGNSKQDRDEEDEDSEEEDQEDEDTSSAEEGSELK